MSFDAPPMKLVSGIYRLAPSEGQPSKTEVERRIELKLRRLVSQYGEADVIQRLRAAPVPKERETERALLIVRAMYTGTGV